VAKIALPNYGMMTYIFAALAINGINLSRACLATWGFSARHINTAASLSFRIRIFGFSAYLFNHHGLSG